MIVSIKRNLWLLTLAVVTTAIVGEVMLLLGQFRAAKRASALYTAKTRELQSFRSTVPAPAAEVVETISADLFQAENDWRDLRETLLGDPPFLVARIEDAGTGRRTEAFFNLARFVEEIRAMAESDGVGLRKNEYFGFSTYANSAPDAEVIECVLRQRQSIAHLLTVLFDAHPISLDGIRREWPRPIDPVQPASGGRTHGRFSGMVNPARAIEGSDFFTLDPRLSVRKVGKLNTLAFRLVFTGATSSLRSLLNGLAHSEVAWFVRSVDVEPARVTAAEEGTLAARKLLPATSGREIPPVIREAISQFTVTVEIVELSGVAAFVKTSAS